MMETNQIICLCRFDILISYHQLHIYTSNFSESFLTLFNVSVFFYIVVLIYFRPEYCFYLDISFCYFEIYTQEYVQSFHE